MIFFGHWNPLSTHSAGDQRESEDGCRFLSAFSQKWELNGPLPNKRANFERFASQCFSGGQLRRVERSDDDFSKARPCDHKGAHRGPTSADCEISRFMHRIRPPSWKVSISEQVSVTAVAPDMNATRQAAPLFRRDIFGMVPRWRDVANVIIFNDSGLFPLFFVVCCPSGPNRPPGTTPQLTEVACFAANLARIAENHP